MAGLYLGDDESWGNRNQTTEAAIHEDEFPKREESNLCANVDPS